MRLERFICRKKLFNFWYKWHVLWIDNRIFLQKYNFYSSVGKKFVQIITAELSNEDWEINLF